MLMKNLYILGNECTPFNRRLNTPIPKANISYKRRCTFRGKGEKRPMMFHNGRLCYDKVRDDNDTWTIFNPTESDSVIMNSYTFDYINIILLGSDAPVINTEEKDPVVDLGAKAFGIAKGLFKSLRKK